VQTNETLAYVPAEQDRLHRGWMVVLLTRAHPVLDWYRILMVKLCECEDGHEKQGSGSDRGD
jgi:hypothetical protein